MKNLIELLTKQNLTLASCESLTDSLFVAKLTEISGVGQIFKGCYMVYSNEAKVKLVKVSSLTLQKYRAISKQCAEEMAQNTQQLLNKILT